MPEVVIPTGQNRDGWIVLSVNGNVQWVKAGVPTTELDAAELEVLGHAGISYSVFDMPGDDEGPAALIDFENGVYQVDGADVALTTLVGDSVEGAFDPNYIIPGNGFNPPIGSSTFHFALKGAALTQVLAGARMVIEANTNNTIKVIAHDDAWNYQVEASLRNGYIEDVINETIVESPNGPFEGEHTFIVVLSDGTNGFAVDDETPVATSSAFSPYGANPPNEIEFIVFPGTGGVETDTAYIKSIAIYPWP